MFNVFTKIKEISQPKVTVEQIHNEFNGKADELLAWAKQVLAQNSGDAKVLAKAKTLSKYGFTTAVEVRKADAINAENRIIAERNRDKDRLKEAIDYFQAKYPLYRFITVEAVIQICRKYGLVYGDVSRFVGTVPDKNLEQIANFHIENVDKAFIRKRSFSSSVNYLGYDELNSNLSNPGMLKYILNGDRYDDVSIAPMVIAGPVSDFNMNDVEIKNFHITDKVKEVPDPVVMFPVIFRKVVYYLIVTAWGDEASDPLVVNQTSN